MASVENQFVNASTEQEWLDFDQFLDLSPSYSDDYSANSISPEMSLPYEGEMFANNLPDLTQSCFPDMATYDISHDPFFADQAPDMGLMPDFVPSCDDAMFTGCQSYDTTYDFRQMVEAQAAVDPRVASLKEKRREAAIALHLQRLCDATALDLEMSSDSNTSFSSPCWSDYMRESISPQSNGSSPEQTSAPPPSGNGGMEMVLDLNMNATANLPKKQKPRSQAQKENYIKARKYGACEKHKKQHKRCNCLEKAAARAGACEVPMDVAFKERPTLQLSPTRTVQSQHSFNASDHDLSRVAQVVRPPIDMTKKAMVKSPVNEPSISPTGYKLCAVTGPGYQSKTEKLKQFPWRYSVVAVLEISNLDYGEHVASNKPEDCCAAFLETSNLDYGEHIASNKPEDCCAAVLETSNLDYAEHIASDKSEDCCAAILETSNLDYAEHIAANKPKDCCGPQGPPSKLYCIPACQANHIYDKQARNRDSRSTRDPSSAAESHACQACGFVQPECYQPTLASPTCYWNLNKLWPLCAPLQNCNPFEYRQNQVFLCGASRKYRTNHSFLICQEFCTPKRKLKRAAPLRRRPTTVRNSKIATPCGTAIRTAATIHQGRRSNFEFREQCRHPPYHPDLYSLRQFSAWSFKFFAFEAVNISDQLGRSCYLEGPIHSWKLSDVC
ncbi:hypothetical protein N7466_008648 [Penicillium verhagenii]|uniref:uncharacterized protein n=1 Tax=Penicillium verhagenii TaxID=1562060 RepID=UPI0025458CC3|nr:uncharacterized protein N7466_008648 [Penicillium verhagenii]KAJ5924461.1 hypothetical protein N7466_008648 [Penicillium verhagenii]